MNLLSAEREGVEIPKPADKEASLGPQSGGPKLAEQLSANVRALLPKHFSSSNPIELPRGHPTVAFSEPQIHAVLNKTILDEAVRSSLHRMRALVLQAVYGGRGQTPARFRKALFRGESPSKSTTVIADNTVHRQAILLFFVESGTRKVRKVVESRTKFLFDNNRVLESTTV